MKKALKIFVAVLVIGIAAALIFKNNVDKDFYNDYDYTLPLDATVTEESDEPGYQLEKVVFTARENETVPALITMPREANDPVPIIIFLHGIGQKKEFITEICEPFVNAGFGLACFDQYMRGERAIDADSPLDELAAFRARAWKTVNDTRRFVDYLVTRDDVDPSRIYLIGASYGAITGATAAAFEKRIGACVLVYGGGGIGALLDSKVGRETVGSWMPLAKAFGTVYLGAADPAQYAHDIAPRPTLLQNGREDSLISVEAAENLQNAVEEPREIIWYDSDHPDNPELVEKIMADALGWLKDQDARIEASLQKNREEIEQAGGDVAMAPLLHTTWKLGDTRIMFTEPGTAVARGGIVSTLSSDGIKVSVEYREGAISLSAMGLERSGTWDGASLVIDGHRARRVWERPAEDE
jgi:dienelactone hydrolase